MNVFEVLNLKRKLFKENGKKPTICYYYYLWNAVKYIGEKRVRKSFESIKGQGNEIIIGDYSSDDNTKQIAEEYGFKVLEIEKDEKTFSESKIRNKVIFESKSNFLIPLNIHVEYPVFLNKFIVNWINQNNIIRKTLRIRTKLENGQFYGFSTLYYKPYLLEVRGYDERTSYSFGSHKYGAMLLKDIYHIKIIAYDFNLIHKNHDEFKKPMLKEIYPNLKEEDLKNKTFNLINSFKKEFSEDFYGTVKKVKNSYW